MGAKSLRQWRQLIQVWTAASDAQVVLDPALLQHFSQGLRVGQAEVLFADGDLEPLDRAVELGRHGQEGFVPRLPLLGVPADETATGSVIPAPDRHVGRIGSGSS